MKIAVVGSGVSGIGAVWALNEYSDHEVHLFEANDYLGGHTHTVEIPPWKGTKMRFPTNVDTGFIVNQLRLVILREGHESSNISEFPTISKDEKKPYS
jgi:predicted NAD/FAD-binding protein